MRKKTKVLSIPVVLAAVVLAASTDAVGAGGVVQSATGSGHFTRNGEQRTFAFSAVKLADGTVHGHAQIISRDDDYWTHIAIDCLKVVGNVALVSGVIIDEADATQIGWTRGFAVVDNGEGANAPADLTTIQSFAFPPGTADCEDFGPADAAPFLVPIEEGNVQIR